MQFTLNHLREFLDFDEDIDKISASLTEIGLEVENISNKGEALKDFTIAKIIDTKPHPDADKLQICKVKTAKEELQIICGASNARKDIYVVLAPIDSIIPNGNFKIRASKIRGLDSFGMLCSAAELGIGEDGGGIIEVENAGDQDIGKNYASFVYLDDAVIEISLTPNRADCLSVYGIARDLAAYNIGKLKKIDFNPAINFANKSTVKASIDKDINNVVFNIIGISNLKNCKSPPHIKQKLELAGFKSVSAIVDITNYICLSFNKPLHAYDSDKIKGDLQVRRARKGEYINALNNNKYELNQNELVIADEQNIQALAGIIGSKDSACELDTTNIILESAYFDADYIREVNLDIDTDSKYRFERHVDNEFVTIGLKLAINLLMEICGTKESLIGKITELSSLKEKDVIIKFDCSLVKKITDIKIENDNIKNILNKLGFEIIKQNQDIIEVKVPSWRKDISLPIDLVEEIIRINGYDKIPVKKPTYQRRVQKDPNYYNISKIKKTLLNAGLSESVSWSFIDINKAALFATINEELRLINPIASHMNYMRPSIIPGLLDAVAKNANRGFIDIALFESGLIYHNSDLAGQVPSVAAIRAGRYNAKNIYKDERDIDIFDIKSDLLEVLGALALPVDRFTYERVAPAYYHPMRSAAVKLGKVILAYFGDVHPSILKKFDIKQNVVAFEILQENLPPKKIAKSTAKPLLELNEFQASNRDFAFIIDRDVEAAAIINAVLRSDKNIEDASLFDIYIGDKIAQDKKSIALSVLIRANHNLSETDLENASKNIIAAVGKLGATLR